MAETSQFSSFTPRNRTAYDLVTLVSVPVVTVTLSKSPSLRSSLKNHFSTASLPDSALLEMEDCSDAPSTSVKTLTRSSCDAAFSTSSYFSTPVRFTLSVALMLLSVSSVSST